MQSLVNKDNSNGVPVPGPDPRPYVPHITLPSNRDTNLLALHQRVKGYLMHWLDGKHYPHIHDRSWCAGCQAGQTPRWTGYLGVLSVKTKNRYVLSIPAAAFREAGLFYEKSQTGCLAGTVFTGYRFGKMVSKNNPAVIEIVEQAVSFPRSNAFHLEAALARYWRRENLDDLREDAEPERAKKEEAAAAIAEKKLIDAMMNNRKGKQR